MTDSLPSPSFGFLLVDKPVGWTSHDVVGKLRRITGVRRIGHAGTLDPFATGLLIVAVGREATRDLEKYVGMDKTYEATFILGATTETLDPESPVIADPHAQKPTQEEITKKMQTLTGAIEQIPPMYSAIKMGGKKLYDLARKGIEVERKPRMVTIHEFTLLETIILETPPIEIAVRIRCSSGTYIRALARDLGVALGTTGYVKSLRRTQIGNLRVEDALMPDAITPDSWPRLLKKDFDAPIAA